MIICKVIGHVWATKKESRLEGMKLMVIREDTGKNADKTYVAVDAVGAGIGERVLVTTGRSAQRAFGDRDLPNDMTIVGIIDSVEIDSNTF